MRLERMAEHQIPAGTIARRLRRSEAAVRAEARKQRVMLAPPGKPTATEKRPYGGMTAPPQRSLARTRAARRASAAPGSAAQARPQRARPTRPVQDETLF